MKTRHSEKDCKMYERIIVVTWGHIFSSFLYFGYISTFFFIGVWLIYNAVLASGVQKSDSFYICVCVVCVCSISDSFPLYVITRY